MHNCNCLQSSLTLPAWAHFQTYNFHSWPVPGSQFELHIHPIPLRFQNATLLFNCHCQFARLVNASPLRPSTATHNLRVRPPHTVAMRRKWFAIAQKSPIPIECVELKMNGFLMCDRFIASVRCCVVVAEEAAVREPLRNRLPTKMKHKWFAIMVEKSSNGRIKASLPPPVYNVRRAPVTPLTRHPSTSLQNTHNFL